MKRVESCLQGLTHELYNPVGLDVELLNQPLKVTPKNPHVVLTRSNLRLSLGLFLGPDSAALGSALRGHTIDELTLLNISYRSAKMLIVLIRVDILD